MYMYLYEMDVQVELLILVTNDQKNGEQHLKIFNLNLQW